MTSPIAALAASPAVQAARPLLTLQAPPEGMTVEDRAIWYAGQTDDLRAALATVLDAIDAAAAGQS